MPVLCRDVAVLAVGCLIHVDAVIKASDQAGQFATGADGGARRYKTSSVVSPSRGRLSVKRRKNLQFDASEEAVVRKPSF
jgi:hypothetical protein